MNKRKKIYQEYVNRWEMVKEKEEQEVREAPFDLLFKQTLSVWEISKSLHLSKETEISESGWSDLQKKWIKSHA